ncbi:hypothetical protein O1D97_01805 [Marinomonas sp. 15G1-11]|uniref:Uncharacterized protein n=1 Tax=Marinomonas phaeophyticola TaxID=3004091 RepID=A0ABT4JPX7_9GAMM|nr:hypothetical protein [Marinomonas sp. 15G1-11]MCZ2720410.1 hypothetical protein [Marinomonas sp. 15G1-11]
MDSYRHGEKYWRAWLFVLRPDIPSKKDGGSSGEDNGADSGRHNITQGHHINTT